MRERARPQRRPEARLEEQGAHGAGRGLQRIGTRVLGERQLGIDAVVRGDVDDERSECTTLAAMKRGDRAGGGRRDPQPGILLVLEQALAPQHPIAWLDKKGRLQADVVFAEQRDPAHLRACMDALLGCAGERQRQAALQAMGARRDGLHG